MENGKQAAFPRTAFDTNGDITTWDDNFQGLTKREYFAAMAMQGLCACPDLAVSRDTLAEESVKQADALLKVLETKSE